MLAACQMERKSNDQICLQIIKTDIKGLFICFDIAMVNYQKTEVCVVNLLAAIIGDQRIKGFGNRVNETQVPKTVFGHLKNM